MYKSFKEMSMAFVACQQAAFILQPADRGPFKTRIVINSMAGKLLSNESERRCSHVDYPVHVAETTSAEYDRVQDGPETLHF